jgi:hypothetical protein
VCERVLGVATVVVNGVVSKPSDRAMRSLHLHLLSGVMYMHQLCLSLSIVAQCDGSSQETLRFVLLRIVVRATATPTAARLALSRAPLRLLAHIVRTWSTYAAVRCTTNVSVVCPLYRSCSMPCTHTMLLDCSWSHSALSSVLRPHPAGPSRSVREPVEIKEIGKGDSR